MYAVQVSQLVMGGEMPAQVTAVGHLGAGGCDESTSISLKYSGGRTATLITSSIVQLPNEVSKPYL